MKKSLSFVVGLLLLGALSSCKKDPSYETKAPRVIRFELFTQKDFSADQHNITFSLVIRNHTRVLFDSTLAIMKIRDIPGIDNKLVFEKTVPGDDHTELAAGFEYAIENVGFSWFIDTVPASAVSKTISYSFQ
jgi:hypothetical protein